MCLFAISAESKGGESKAAGGSTDKDKAASSRESLGTGKALRIVEAVIQRYMGE